MNKNVIFAFIACLAFSGCFDNKNKPEDVPTVSSVEQLSKTNRAEVVRLYLRGSKTAVKEADLSDLPSLKVLDLSELRYKTIPSAVFKLTNLKQLYFAYNELETLPSDMANLKELEYLNLDGNRLVTLGENLAPLTNIRWLRLNGNRLKDLPQSISAMASLQRIYLKNNRMKEVPECLKGMQLLEDISLDGNVAITEIPDWVVELPSLHNLSFSGCGIKKLPDDIGGFKKLKSLNLSACPISVEEMARIREALPKVAIVF
jgi:Leucine-rich repeat (LRR) protein